MTHSTLPDRLLAVAETLNEIADDTRGHALNGEQHDALREAAAALSVPADKGEPIAWRKPTPYGVGYNFASEEVMRDMARWIDESFDKPVPDGREAVASLLDALDEIAHTTERSLVVGAETYSTVGHAKCVRIANEAIDSHAIAAPTTPQPGDGIVVPEGFVLAPKIATEEMIEAGEASADERPAYVYAAMIAAAPSAKGVAE